MIHCAPMLGTVLAGLLLAQAPVNKTVSIAVTDLKARGVDEVAAGALTTEVTNTVAGLGVFSVISGEDIKRLLTLEATRQACTGDADAACLAEIGGALGVDYLVYGEVAKLGDTYSISLSLLNTAEAQAVGRANRKVDSPAKLLTETESLTKLVMRSLLERFRGSLVLEVAEPQAQVKIDGRVVGVSPLTQRIDLAMGPHDIRVDKAGFIAWAKTVEVAPNQVTVTPVSMVPNQNFIESYQGTAETVRVFAWVTAGAAVAALGTAGALRLISDARFDDLVSKRHLEQQGVCAARDPTFSRTDFCPTELGRANDVAKTVDSIETMDTVALASAIGGALSGIISVVLFVSGDDPGRYSAYDAGTAQTTIVPTKNGIGVSGTF